MQSQQLEREIANTNMITSNDDDGKVGESVDKQPTLHFAFPLGIGGEHYHEAISC